MIIVDDWMMSSGAGCIFGKFHHPSLDIRKLKKMHSRLLDGEIILDHLTAVVAGVSLLTRLNPIMNNAGDVMSGGASTAIHKATAFAGLGDTDIV